MTTSEAEKSVSDKSLTTIIYALYAVSLLFGVTCLIAIIMNYVKRDDVQGTWLESHFRWQIRTFWFALLWVTVAVLAGLTVVGLPFAWIVAVVAGLWVLYRIARGWLRLLSEKGMPQ